MKKLYYCNGCEARFEADESLFEGDRIRCPKCGKEHPRGGYSEVNFCPNCREPLLFPLDLPPDQEVTCPKCSSDFFTTGFAVSNPSGYVELKPGTLFDKYKIIRLLGRGGMGEVYLAQDRLLERECALKVLSLDTENDSSYAARFIQEAKLGDRLNHPNIVRVYNVGTELKTGRFFIAMEYVNGDSLSHLAKKRKFTEKELLKIGITACQALEAMANAGVVHRDLKPSNIMMNDAGEIKLMDLGIAKSEDRQHGDVTLTQCKEVFGTPEYAAPEQCQAAHLADHRSDIYSLGATLFHLASGEPPYDGKSTLEIILKVLKDPPKDLHKIAPELSPAFVALIQWMMMRDPADRPQTAAEARVRMEAVLKGDHSIVIRSFLKKKKRWLGGAAAVLLLSVAVAAVICAVRKVPAAKTDRQPETGSGYTRQNREPFDAVLAKRLAKCEEQLNALRSVKEKDPAKQTWSRHRLGYQMRQQALLKGQIQNRKLAHEAAKRGYSAQNGSRLSGLQEQLEKLPRRDTAEKIEFNKVLDQFLQLLQDPQTDPNPVIREEKIFRDDCKKEPDEEDRRYLQKRTAFRQLLIKRHVLFPDDYVSKVPEFIRYGIPVAEPTEENLAIMLLAGHEFPLQHLLPHFPSQDTLPKGVRCAVTQNSALHYAVCREWKLPAVTGLMMQNDIKIDTVDEQGQTALHWAVKYGRRELIPLLLAAGCNPDVRDKHGRKYTDCEYLHDIYVACKSETWDRLRANFRYPDDAEMISPFDRMTVLQYLCCRPAAPQTVHCMLDRGADPLAIGFRIETPLQLLFDQLCESCSSRARFRNMILRSHSQLIQLLERLDKMDSVTELKFRESDKDDSLPFELEELWKYLANFARNRAERLKNKSVQHPAAIEEKKMAETPVVKDVAAEQKNETPAAENKNKTVVMEAAGYAPQKGESLDTVLEKRLAKCEARLTALKNIQESDPDKQAWNKLCIEYMQQQQALLKEQQNNRKLAREAVQRQYSQQNTRELNILFAQLNQFERNHKRHSANEYNIIWEKMLKLLRDPQTNPNLSSYQLSMLFTTFVYHHTRPKTSETSRLLIQHHILLPDNWGSCSAEPAFIRYGVAAAVPNKKNIEIMLLAGHSLSTRLQRDYQGINHSAGTRALRWQGSALFMAIWRDWTPALKGIIMGGNDVNEIDEEGQTALHWAVKYGRKELIPLLLAAGCDPEKRDKHGRKYTDCEYLHDIAVACKEKNWDQMRTAFRYPEDANMLSHLSGMTFLQYLCYLPASPETVLRMLDLGADPMVIGYLPWGMSRSAPLEIIVNTLYRCCSKTYYRNKNNSTLLRDSSAWIRVLERLDQMDPVTNPQLYSQYSKAESLPPELEELWKYLEKFTKKRAERLKNKSVQRPAAIEEQKTAETPVVKDVAAEQKNETPAAENKSKPVAVEAAGYAPQKGESLDTVLEKRLAKCEARLTALKNIQESDPDKQAWNKLCIEYMQQQQTLLKEQVENRKLAQKAAKRKYSAENGKKLLELLKQLNRSHIMTSFSEKVERNRLMNQILLLLQNPQTDPNLIIRDSESRFLWIHLSNMWVGQNKQDNEYQKYLKKVQSFKQLLVQRHVLFPDDFSSEEPVFIRYGIPFAVPTGENLNILLLAGHPVTSFMHQNVQSRIRIYQRKQLRVTGLRMPIGHYAVMQGWNQALMQMIMTGNDVTLTDEEGQTALHWAVKYDHKDFIPLLLAAGCDPKIRDKQGRTYTDCEYLSQIMPALQKREWAKLRSCIRCREDANFLTPSKRILTLLQVLCHNSSRGAMETILFLLDHGADPGLTSPGNHYSAIDSYFDALYRRCFWEKYDGRISADDRQLAITVLQRLDGTAPLRFSACLRFDRERYRSRYSHSPEQPSPEARKLLDYLADFAEQHKKSYKSYRENYVKSRQKQNDPPTPQRGRNENDSGNKR